MRLKYYILSLRQMNGKKSFVFFLFLVILVTPLIMYQYSVKPIIKSLCESNAKNICVKSSNAAVYGYIRDIKYQDLIDIQKDNSNKVTAIIADVMEMNRITNKVTTKLEEEMAKNQASEINFPIGALFGSNVLAGYGPKINIKTLPVGELDVEIKSEFTQAGINQTKHRIIIAVTASVKTVAPFFSETQKYQNDIVIAESVIVGDVPSSYYNIEGVEGLSQKESLNLLENN